MDYSCCTMLILLSLTASFFAFANAANTTPAESLYDITLRIQDTATCTVQKYNSFCSSLQATLGYKGCTMSTKNCNTETALRISFATYKNKQSIRNSLQSYKNHEGMTITAVTVSDVNECLEKIHTCSINGYCTNTEGAYRCNCGNGYSNISQSQTYCVARCNPASCRKRGKCVEAVDEVLEVTCECENGYSGDFCQDVSNTRQIPYWSIIFISVIAAVAAIVGFGLCTYTCYRLFVKKPSDDDNSDTNSIASYKPRAIPSLEYDRITDMGSVSRGNRGFASTIEEESEHASVKNDGLKFGTRLSSSRLSIPSEHGDPTPVLNPFNHTDRHAASDIISQPDYY